MRGLLPGTEVRPVTLTDVPILTGLFQRVAMAAVGTPDSSEDEVHDDLVGPRLNLETDTFIVVDAAGRAVAYGQAYDEHDDRGYVDVFVDPGLDEATFTMVAQRGVAAALTRLGDAVRDRSADSTTASAGLYRGEDLLRKAYEENGFAYSTTYWRMSIDISDASIVLPELPAGVEIRAVDPDDDDVVSAALAVRNEAFTGHHGHVDMLFDAFAAVWRGTTKYDRNGWWIAYDNEVPVGINLCDEAKADEGAGFVRTLGVLAGSRGRGIAKALLLTSFAEYARRGRSSVQLGVDSANDTGATRLYEAVGMERTMAFDTFERKVMATS